MSRVVPTHPGDDAISPTMADDVRVRGDGLSRLAGATGGTLLQLVGTDPDPFRRVLRESSGHYLLAFEPRPEDRDGATHRISVSVRRPSITVRARPVFSAPPPPVAAMSVEDQLVQLLRNRRIATDLAVGLGVTAVRAAVGSTVQAHATIQLDPPADATFGAVVVNSGGTVVTSATSRTTTGQLSFPVGVAPGRYLFRGAVIDPSGRAGTVERTLDIALRGDRLKMSDLVLTAAVPAAGELPVVERVTASELRAALQIYAPRDWAAAANVRLELASAGGGVRTPGRGATAWVDEGFWLASGTFDVGSLPSGRYVVSAAVPGEAPVTRSVFLVR